MTHTIIIVRIIMYDDNIMRIANYDSETPMLFVTCSESDPDINRSKAVALLCHRNG